MGKRGQDNRDQKYLKAFGRRVRELRERLAWVQGDLAASSGVSDAQISAIENGHEGPQLNTLKAIALSLGLTPSKLLDFPYDLKINTNFKKGKVRRSGVTSHIKELHQQGYFKQVRSVSDVIVQCNKKFDLTFKSAETSGVLLLLVKAGRLKKTTDGQNRNLYQQV